MKKLLFTLIFLAGAFAASAQSKIVTDSIQSKALGCEQKFNVYLPNGYKATESYPVIYLLHGLYGDYSNWAGTGRMKDVADELIASGELVPTVIIMPNAGDNDVHNYQNGYFNVQNWPYEDFFFQEFLPAAEKKGRIPKRSSGVFARSYRNRGISTAHMTETGGITAVKPSMPFMKIAQERAAIPAPNTPKAVGRGLRTAQAAAERAYMGT